MMTYKKLKDLTPAEITQADNLKTWMSFHGKPKTRREFLASGAVLGGAGLVLPTALNMFLASAQANAATCAASKGTGMVVINLSGGWSGAGNVMFTDTSGNPMPSYEGVGGGTQAQATAGAVKVFANGPAFFSVSQFMTGLLTKITPQTISRTNMLSLAVASQDDSNNNAYDLSPMAAAVAAGNGAFLPVLGTPANQPAQLAAVPALAVNGLTSITNAISVQGAVAALSTADKGKLFSMIQNLSSTQQASLSSVSGYNVLSSLIQKATATNVTLVGNSSSLVDPQQATGLNTGNIFNFGNGSDLTNASVIYNAINGNAPMGNIVMGGYDYHGQGRATQDTKDNAAGVLVGQALQTAANIGSKICVVVTSDGSVAHAVTGTAGSAATGDLGVHGSMHMFLYDPAGAHPQTSGQVGGYTGSGTAIGVDETTAIGASPALGSAAVIANYMSFLGQPTGISTVAPTAFTSDQIAQVVKIS